MRVFYSEVMWLGATVNWFEEIHDSIFWSGIREYNLGDSLIEFNPKYFKMIREFNEESTKQNFKKSIH